MQLLPGDWRYLDNWRKEMERYLDNFSGGFGSPRIDVYETETEVVASCDLPGIENKEDIQINVADDLLTIQGEVRRDQKIAEQSLHRRERMYGHFKRSVSLPTSVRAEGVRASYRNGILEVRLPKAEHSVRRQIEIDFQ